MLRRADALGFTEGATWTEDHVGTNAIGTALAEPAPVQLFSAEHFEEGQHPWYCTASPVHDPRTGALLGVVDVSGPALTLHPALVALVDTATKLAEARLWRHHEQALDRLRRSAEHVLATTTGPLLLVDDDGWVAHHAGVLVRDRIAAPRADRAARRARARAVRAGAPRRRLAGAPRRAGRAAHRPAAHASTARACSRCPGPRMPVGAGAPRSPRATPPSCGCSPQAGPEGLSAARLSRALFGDDEHLVTVRAEVSRLRRVVGAIVGTAPYRVADGVRLVCDD